MQAPPPSFTPPMYPPQHVYRPYKRHFSGLGDGGQGNSPFSRRFPSHHGHSNSYNNASNPNAPVQLGPDGKPLPPGEYDGKRMRKAIQRRTVDYNASIIQQIKSRTWKKCPGKKCTLQPDPQYYIEVNQPKCIRENPVNSISTRFVRTSTNKIRCPIFAGAWTPEGRRLVTGASSGEFTLWNGLTFNFETILQAHDTSIRAMEWSHNDMWLLSGDHSGSIKYWQSNMNNVKMLQAHSDPIRGLSFSPTDNKFVTCSDDGLVKIWDFYRCYEERLLRGHGADVKCIDWHPTKGLIVSGSKDSQQPIKLWDAKSGRGICTLHLHKSTVMDLQWNRNGNWLLTSSRDHLVKVFDIRAMAELQVFRGHKKEATVIDWHPIHESMFASGGSEGSMFFWQVGCDKETGSMTNAHDGMIWMLQWHPLGHIICSGSNDHTCKFWTRNRPGDKMKDKYNLNVLPVGSEEEYEYDVPSKEEAEANLSVLSESGLVTPVKAVNVSFESVEIPGLSVSTPSHFAGNEQSDTASALEQIVKKEVIIPMLDKNTSPSTAQSGFHLPSRKQGTTPAQSPASEVLPMLNDVFAVPQLEQQLARFDTSQSAADIQQALGPPLSVSQVTAESMPLVPSAPPPLMGKSEGNGLLPTPSIDHMIGPERRLSESDHNEPARNQEASTGVGPKALMTLVPTNQPPNEAPQPSMPRNQQMLSWRHREDNFPPSQANEYRWQQQQQYSQEDGFRSFEGPQMQEHYSNDDSMNINNPFYHNGPRQNRGRGKMNRRGRPFQRR